MTTAPQHHYTDRFKNDYKNIWGTALRKSICINSSAIKNMIHIYKWVNLINSKIHIYEIRNGCLIAVTVE